MNPEDSGISSGTNKENTDATLSVRKTSKGDFQELHKEQSAENNKRLHSATVISLKERQIIEKIRKSGVEGQKNAIKKLIIVSIICTFFMVAELIGGIWSGSLAILSDAAHMLSDFMGFAISMISIIVSRNKPTFKLSFGYHRAEVIGALCSILLIWGLTIWLIYEAIEKIVNDVKVDDAYIMLYVAIIGLICNIVMGHVLHSAGGHHHGHSHGSHSHGAHDHAHSHGEKKEIKDEKNDKKKVNQSPDNNIKEPLLPEQSDKEEKHEHVHKEGEKCGGHKHDHKEEQHIHEHSELKHEHKEGEKCGGHDHGGHDHGGHDHDGHDHDGHDHDGHDHEGHNHDGHDHGDHNEEEDHHHNLNIRAAFIHVVGDLIQSVGVVIAAVVIIIWKDWYIVDPICTFVFSVIVFFTTIPILCDCIKVFMEGTPTGIEPSKILADLYTLPGVEEVHDLHVWALNMGRNALSCHIRSRTPMITLKKATRLVNTKYKILHTTIQIEHINDTYIQFECVTHH